MLILLHESENAPYAVQATNSLLSQPRLYLGESFRHQVFHHLRFSIEYLRTQRLIDAKGEPMDFCACISHLYFTENAAFSFHAPLKEGYFGRLACRFLSNEIDTLRQLMIVLANLFGRQPCKFADREKAPRTGSIVFLPYLPEEAAKVLRQHNSSTLKMYQNYVRTYAEYCNDEDRTLPFTGLTVGASVPPNFDISFLNSLPPTDSRSSFFALSGHSDHFTSISDLCSSLRSGISLEKAVAPHLDTGDDLKAPLNAYLLDFYSHGDRHALEVANGIRRGDVWYLLNDFSLMSATIVASLENFLKPGWRS
jgi:ATP-dependent RNA helicase DDX60